MYVKILFDILLVYYIKRIREHFSIKRSIFGKATFNVVFSIN